LQGFLALYSAGALVHTPVHTLARKPGHIGIFVCVETPGVSCHESALIDGYAVPR